MACAQLARRLVGVVLLVGMACHAALLPVDLRCEQLVSPQGLDLAQPRLSWRFADEARLTRGEGQTAYQVRVLETPRDRVAWDTGRVAGNESNLVPYAGEALRPFAVYRWQVRVWDQARAPSPWSEPATWTMGPLAAEDWARARWIGLPEAVYQVAPPTLAVDLKEASWIWTDEGTPRKDTPKGARHLRRVFDTPAGTKGSLCLTADNEVEVWLNGKPVLASKYWKVAEIVDVTEALRPGRNVLAAKVVNHRGPDSPAGLVGRLLLRLPDGKEQRIDTDAAWRWHREAPEGWLTPDFGDDSWTPATVLGKHGCGPWNQVRIAGATPTQTVPSPLLRREFAVTGPLTRATVTVCGLGYFELRLNGGKVGDLALAPRFTTYTKRVLYETFEVTGQIREGANALGLMLGNGFYNQHARAAWDMDRAPWRAMPCAILLLRLERPDGTVETVVSDENWQAIPGPYLFDGIRNGVVYDPARLPEGWDQPGFAGKDWLQAGLRPAPQGQLRADRSLPIRITREFQPVDLKAAGEGRWLFDGGRNTAGWVRLRVVGQAGGRVVLRYRELLRPDGSLDNRNQAHTHSGPFQTDTFLLTGGEQIVEPRFVYHGFRYIEVSGDIVPPELADLTVRVVGTDFPLAGEFACSNELLNRIQDATLRAYRSNFVGMPTDCPHREKNGWTGDAQLAAETGLFNYAGGPAYACWLEDMGDCQKPDGDFPGIVPTGSWGYGIGPAWDAAYFVLPAHLREYLGDDRAVTERYPGMQLYLDFLAQRAPDRIVRFGLGDWCPPEDGSQAHKCPRDLTGTAYYAVFARQAVAVASLLGREEDRQRYAALAEGVAETFNRTFLDRAQGTYAGDTQTSLACALYQDLVPADQRDRVFARLVADVEAHNRHLDCGILGTKYLLNVLTDGGRSDLAYAIATQTDFPSWGLWLAQGATTLWENWNGGASHNHVMFGDISAWCYKALAGIRPDAAHPGFRQFILKPDPVGDLSEVRAWHLCPYGRIVSEWQREGDRFTWHVFVPPGTLADTLLPAVTGTVQEGGQPLVGGNGIRLLGWQDGRQHVKLASGEYHFVSQLAAK